jgi:hypothetical protein
MDPWYVVFSFKGPTPMTLGETIEIFTKRPSVQLPTVIGMTDFCYSFTSKLEATNFGYFVCGGHDCASFFLFSCGNMEFR